MLEGGGKTVNLKAVLLGKEKFKERYGWDGEEERGERFKEEVERYYREFYKGEGGGKG